jgi:hypothetical protein
MLQGEIEGGTLLERHQLIRARKSDGSQLKPRLAMPRLRKKGFRPPHDGPLRHGPQESASANPPPTFRRREFGILEVPILTRLLASHRPMTRAAC